MYQQFNSHFTIGKESGEKVNVSSSFHVFCFRESLHCRSNNVCVTKGVSFSVDPLVFELRDPAWLFSVVTIILYTLCLRAWDIFSEALSPYMKLSVFFLLGSAFDSYLVYEFVVLWSSVKRVFLLSGSGSLIARSLYHINGDAWEEAVCLVCKEFLLFAIWLALFCLSRGQRRQVVKIQLFVKCSRRFSLTWCQSFIFRFVDSFLWFSFGRRFFFDPKRLDSLSVFLNFANGQSLPSGWRCYLKFRLTLVNQVKYEHSIHRGKSY